MILIKKQKYPKVLIIGHFPGDNTGTQVTLKNLFYNWPSEELAVASTSSYEKMKSKMCDRYYFLGNDDVQASGLLALFYKNAKSISYVYNKGLDFRDIDNTKNNGKRLSALKNKLLDRVLNPFLLKTGLYFSRFKYSVSQQFKDWIDDFNPDLIITMLGDISSMKFALEIKSVTKKKLVIYILDDWVSANSSYSVFPGFWQKRFDDLFNKVVDEADIHIAICDKMANEYGKKYNKKFFSFHNPVVVSDFNILKKVESNQAKKLFVITYVGKINRDTLDGLLDIITAIDSMNEIEIQFNIYSGSNNKMRNKILNSKKVQVISQVTHKIIPQVLVDSDLLFLPLSFSIKSRKYTRLSMPTKVSEYMASKTPILVYAPKEIAVTEYARRDKWALTVSERSIALLHKEIKRVISNDIEIQNITANAYKLAKEKHNSIVVRENFRLALKGQL